MGSGLGMGLLVAMFTTFTGGWVGGWCGEVKNRANLSQVRLKLRLSLAIFKPESDYHGGNLYELSTNKQQNTHIPSIGSVL